MFSPDIRHFPLGSLILALVYFVFNEMFHYIDSRSSRMSCAFGEPGFSQNIFIFFLSSSNGYSQHIFLKEVLSVFIIHLPKERIF